MEWSIVVAIITLPLTVMAVEAYISVYTRSKKHHFNDSQGHSFRILVPIWGNIKYLENVEYLETYGTQVTLCTTGDESDEFYTDIRKLKRKFGFKIYIDKPILQLSTETLSQSKRSTSGTIRDRIIRNALNGIKEEFVIPLDADSTTKVHMSYLIGELVSNDFDITSIKILPTNHGSILAKMQMYEYQLAMRLRFIAPWLISGACHPAKTKVLQDIMSRHSLFFQGNDVETGLLAKTLGYKVGHIPFEVLTTVPDSFKAWFRQRLAWSGGEFRLFIVNFKFILKHPFFWIYGAIVTIILFPFRWYAMSTLWTPLLILLIIYLLLSIFIHWKNINIYIFLLPFYTIFLSLVMVPLGIYWYFYMAIKDKNAGIIKINRNHE